MQEYLRQVRRIQTTFESFNLSYILKNGNTHADSLATLATSSAQNLPLVILVENLCALTPIKKDLLHVHQIKLGPSWMNPILLFLGRDILPEEKSKAEKVRRKTPRFWMSEDKKLYKRSFSGPYHLCVHPDASESLLEELHEGVCGSHTEEDLYLIGPVLEDTGGQACKRRHKNMLGNVISVRDLRQTFTSLKEFSILFPAFGLLLNGVWIL